MHLDVVYLMSVPCLLRMLFIALFKSLFRFILPFSIVNLLLMMANALGPNRLLFRL